MAAAAHVIPEQRVALKQVLCATDFSHASERAFNYAQAVARICEAELTLVHAVPGEMRIPVPLDRYPELDRDRISADQHMRDWRDKFSVESCNTRLERGAVWKVLSSVMQDEHTDLLVLGTRGRSGIRKLVLGSVAEEALRQATCPVLTVGPNVRPAEPADFHRILFATDFGPASAKALPYVSSLSGGRPIKLALVHMLPPAPIIAAGYLPMAGIADDFSEWQSEAQRESLKKLKDIVPQDMNLSGSPEYIVRTDFLPEGILDEAKQFDVDLIVMGANRTVTARLASHIPWAVTYHVIAEARCPVLTVRS